MDTLGEIDLDDLYDEYREERWSRSSPRRPPARRPRRPARRPRPGRCWTLMAALESSVRAARESRGGKAPGRPRRPRSGPCRSAAPSRRTPRRPAAEVDLDGGEEDGGEEDGSEEVGGDGVGGRGRREAGGGEEVDGLRRREVDGEVRRGLGRRPRPSAAAKKTTGKSAPTRSTAKAPPRAPPRRRHRASAAPGRRPVRAEHGDARLTAQGGGRPGDGGRVGLVDRGGRVARGRRCERRRRWAGRGSPPGVLPDRVGRSAARGAGAGGQLRPRGQGEGRPRRPCRSPGRPAGAGTAVQRTPGRAGPWVLRVPQLTDHAGRTRVRVRAGRGPGRQPGVRSRAAGSLMRGGGADRALVVLQELPPDVLRHGRRTAGLFRLTRLTRLTRLAWLVGLIRRRAAARPGSGRDPALPLFFGPYGGRAGVGAGGEPADGRCAVPCRSTVSVSLPGRRTAGGRRPAPRRIIAQCKRDRQGLRAALSRPPPSPGPVVMAGGLRRPRPAARTGWPVRPHGTTPPPSTANPMNAQKTPGGSRVPPGVLRHDPGALLGGQEAGGDGVVAVAELDDHLGLLTEVPVPVRLRAEAGGDRPTPPVRPTGVVGDHFEDDPAVTATVPAGVGAAEAAACRTREPSPAEEEDRQPRCGAPQADGRPGPTGVSCPCVPFPPS